MKVISWRAIFPAPAVLATHNAAQQSSFSLTFVGSFDLEFDKISLYLVWFLSKHCFCSFVGSLLKRFHSDKCRIRIVYLVLFVSLPEWRCVWKTERGHYACVPVSPNIWIGKFAEKGRLTDQNEQIKNLFSVVNFANSHLLFLTLIYVILWNELGAHLHANYKHKITEIHQRNKHTKNGLDSIIGGFHCVRINAVKKER